MEVICQNTQCLKNAPPLMTPAVARTLFLSWHEKSGIAVVLTHLFAMTEFMVVKLILQHDP
jgi:hypothetical protein